MTRKKKLEAIASGHGKGCYGVIQGLITHVHDGITSMDRFWNAASEKSIVKCLKKANCMTIVVNEKEAAVPASA